MRNGQPESLTALLKNTSLLTIKERSEALSKLNELLAKLLPEILNQQCKVVNYRQGVLIIAVSSASWLTRLRYEQETLRSQLRQNGLRGLSSIQFKIDPVLNSQRTILHSPAPPLYHRRLTQQSAQSLLSLAENCPTSLKKRLIELAKHAVKTDNDSQQ